MPRLYPPAMFVVSEADAAATPTAYEQEGELSAAIELRRRFPGIADKAEAGSASGPSPTGKPLPAQPRPVTRLRPRKDS